VVLEELNHDRQVAGAVQTVQMAGSQYRDYTFNATDDCGNAADQKVRITRQYDMTKPIITPAADYSLVGCNTAWPTISKCTLDRQLWCWRS
jgi:hypothetical protein